MPAAGPPIPIRRSEACANRALTGMADAAELTCAGKAVSGQTSIGQASQQRALTGLEDVGRLQRDPEALELSRLLLAVMVLLAHPPLRGGLGQLQLEDVPVLDLEPVRADVVLACVPRNSAGLEGPMR